MGEPCGQVRDTIPSPLCHVSDPALWTGKLTHQQSGDSVEKEVLTRVPAESMAQIALRTRDKSGTRHLSPKSTGPTTTESYI